MFHLAFFKHMGSRQAAGHQQGWAKTTSHTKHEHQLLVRSLAVVQAKETCLPSRGDCLRIPTLELDLSTRVRESRSQ